MAKKPAKNRKLARPAPRSKSAKRPSQKAKSTLTNRFTDLLDRRLLDIATKQYARLMREVARGRKRLDAEARVAMQVGERIIAKAKEVKESLVRK